MKSLAYRVFFNPNIAAVILFISRSRRLVHSRDRLELSPGLDYKNSRRTELLEHKLMQINSDMHAVLYLCVEIGEDREDRVKQTHIEKPRAQPSHSVLTAADLCSAHFRSPSQLRQLQELSPPFATHSKVKNQPVLLFKQKQALINRHTHTVPLCQIPGISPLLCCTSAG